jgi:small subunit ribosomal protein S6
MTNKYEVIYIINTELGEEGIQELVEKFKSLLETSAQLDHMDEWGKRKLAYPVKDRNEGYYVLAEFTSDSEFPKELERNFKITEGILKYIIIRKD